MRANWAVPRRFIARLVALACIGVVPLAASVAIGTPVASAATGHDDTVLTFGNASFHGSTSGRSLPAPIVGMASTPDGKGYWLVASNGAVYSFHTLGYGGLAKMHLNAPVIGMAASPTGHGYWLVAKDGGVFTFGDAHFYGSTGAMHLNAPVTELVPGPNGKGYWLMASDGGVFTFGSAHFYGSMGGSHLNAPVIGMTATPKGHGYLLVASDGGVFTFGDALFRGSTGDRHLASPVVGLAGDSTNKGYWLATQAGNVFAFGDAQNSGNAVHLLGGGREVIQITSVPGTTGYRLLAQQRPLMLAPPLGVGSSGPAVAEVQSRLLSLGFWIPGVTGSYDSLTEQAVFAFQKWNGLARTGTVDLVTHAAFNTAVRPRPRSTSGHVIEIDKTRQVLIVANAGQAAWVFNASSGSDHPYVSEGVGYSAHTPEGMFKVIRQVDGFDKSPLGELYRPKYFTNTGIAVHGYPIVPPYPASHGCVRVSNAAIDFMWGNNILPIGTPVWVYV